MQDVQHLPTILIGAGPASLQAAYFLETNAIPYVILEQSTTSGSFFSKYPHSKTLISLNKKYTGKSLPDFNLRHDWNSLLNEGEGEGEGENPLLFTQYSDKLYPSSDVLHLYFNDFMLKYQLKVNYNTRVISITKDSTTLLYTICTNQITYTCNKLIIGTGMSTPVYPNIVSYNVIKHYADFENGHFTNNATLDKYKHTRVLLIGGGNSAYELANILQHVCASVIILGSNKKMALVSHYVGDVRSVYLPFLDTFYLKSMNGIDVMEYEKMQCQIIQNKNNTCPNYLKYTLSTNGKSYYANTPDLEWFDEIIYCTGWKFDTSIFKFDVNLIKNKYPEIKDNYESIQHENLFFIGSLMHSKDTIKGSGGFIHGFRYLIKLFAQIHYKIPITMKLFKFSGNMDCYKQLADYIYNRINNASSLYQMYGTLCDVFYFDESTMNIVYVEDWKLSCLEYLNIPDECKHINALFLEYGAEETQITRLGSFNKWNPVFLHPKIYTFHYTTTTRKKELSMIDRIVFEENIIADFKNKQTYYEKIKQTLKMCNLII